MVIILSIIVMIGWFIKSQALVKIIPTYAAMVFNTALCFFGLGIALLFLPTRFVWVTRIASVLVGLLSFFILMQYVFHVNLHVDELFFHYNLPEPMQFPGRTSLNTALTMLLAPIRVLQKLGKNLYLSFCCFFYDSYSSPCHSQYALYTGF